MQFVGSLDEPDSPDATGDTKCACDSRSASAALARRRGANAGRLFANYIYRLRCREPAVHIVCRATRAGRGDQISTRAPFLGAVSTSLRMEALRLSLAREPISCVENEMLKADKCNFWSEVYWIFNLQMRPQFFLATRDARATCAPRQRLHNFASPVSLSLERLQLAAICSSICRHDTLKDLFNT